MSLDDLMTADSSNVFLNTDEFAEGVTHWPAGVSGSAATVTALFFEMSRVTEEEDRGKKITRKAVIQIPTSTTVTKKDVWYRNSERWETLTTGNKENGLLRVHLIRTEKVKTKNKNSSESDDVW